MPAVHLPPASWVTTWDGPSPRLENDSMCAFVGIASQGLVRLPVSSGANEDVLADPQGRVLADWHSENP
jgi:hypothetical protein